MLDSTRFERTFTIAPTQSLGRGAVNLDRVHLSFYRPRRIRIGWPGRTAVCVDRESHGRVRRLGNAAALRTALVRGTGPLLWGHSDRTPVEPAAGVGCSLAFRIGSVYCRSRCRLARLEALWRRKKPPFNDRLACAPDFL